MIVYLKCSSNNKATTVFGLFLQAISRLGLPSRVRSDQGGENTLVALHMIRYRGAQRRSMIVGSSVHNQRIERLWRDLFSCVIRLYYRLFYFLEARGLLQSVNEVHLYALHYVYLPRINQSLTRFCDGWNHHGIPTAQHQSPHQMFTAGALRLQESGLHGLDFFTDVDSFYGVEELGLPSEDSQGVQIPENSFCLREDHFRQLQGHVDPLQESPNYGIDLYVRTVEFSLDCIDQNPSVYS